MARRTFFSFHYRPDVQRAQVVRNSWVTKDREDAGFFDSSVFEASQKESDDALKRFLWEGLKNTSVTCVLAGSETAKRRWVRYELVQSFRQGKGILCVKVHSIRGFDKKTCAEGPNPLEQLAYKVDGEHVLFFELNGTKWEEYEDAPSMKLSDTPYAPLGDKDYKRFSSLFMTYDWASEVDTKLGAWIEAAAKAAGR